MRKVIAVLLAVVLLLSISFVNFSAGGEELALEVKGAAVQSFDGNARLINPETGEFNGNVSVIELNDAIPQEVPADDAWNDGTTAETFTIDDYSEGYSWMSDSAYGNEKEPYYWLDNPEEKGENLLFLAEYRHMGKEGKIINYTWASNLPATLNTPEEAKESYVKYEPIPTPMLNERADDPIGPSHLNISIPYFKYTDYNGVTGKPDGKGNFDCLQSYAVFIKDTKGEQFKDWTYLGNSRPDPRWNKEAEPPIWANDYETDPSKINTGRDYFDTREHDVKLIEGYEYVFKVRVNFQSREGNDMGGVWGYGGGLGEANIKPKTLAAGNVGGGATTFSSSGKSGGMVTGEETTPPSITITEPDPGDYKDSSFTVTWSGSDSGSGIDYYEIKLDSGDYYDKGTDTSHLYGSVSHGSHTVYVRAWDKAGNSNTDSVNFNVDDNAPSISITSPSSGMVTNQTDVSVTWSGSDSGAGDSGIYAYYRKLDSGSYLYEGTSTSYTYTSLSDGTHTVYIRAYDNVGNINTDSISFEVDTVDPTVSITSPSEGEILKDTDVTIEWSGGDLGSGIYYYEVRDDGSTWRNKSTSTSHPYSLTEGGHTVDVRATDNAGNSITDTVSFTVAYSQDYALDTNAQSDDWTFLSTELIPINTNLIDILEDPDYGISGNYSKVMWYDASSSTWRSYIPGREEVYNDLSAWNETMGIWIQITGKDPLTIKGTYPSSTDIKLYPGWNMVGFPSKSDKKADLTLPDEVTKIGIFDETEQYNIRYITDLTTYTMTSGVGYWVYNSYETVITWTVTYS
ncbi:MAG: Ig-like domain-containing protein [Thermoplasmatota archaeon]